MSITSRTSSFGTLSRRLHMRILGGESVAPWYYQEDSSERRVVSLTGSDQMVYVTNRSANIYYPLPNISSEFPGLMMFGVTGLGTGLGGSWLTPFFANSGASTLPRRLEIPFDMTVTGMYVAADTAGSGDKITTIVLEKNRVATNLSATIAYSANPFVGNSSTEVEFSAGDLIGMTFFNTADAGTSPVNVFVGIRYTTPSARKNVLAFHASSLLTSATGTQWLSCWHKATAASTTVLPFVLIHTSGTIRNMRMHSLTGTVGGSYTLYKTGSATDFVVGVSADVAETSGSYSASELLVDPGDWLNVGMVGTGSPAGNHYYVTLEFEEN